MDLFAAWLLYPLVALAVCGGLGLLVEQVAGSPLPGALLLPVGMAGLVSTTQLTTYWDRSAELTLPLVLVLAVAGLVLGRARLRARPDGWALAACAGVFAVFAAPIVLSGEATFAGYTILGDTSIHMIGADVLLHHGRDFSSLPSSSYRYSLEAYYGTNGYPSGGPTAAGALTSLVHQDIAWTFQMFLSLLVTLAAAALWSLFTPLVASRPLRALLTFVAAQPSLVLAYALQGSLKEVGSEWGVVLVAALLPVYAAAPPGPRRAVPLAVASSAFVGIVGLAGGVWLGPLLLAALVAGLARERRGWILPVLEAVTFVVLAAVLNYQSLLDLRSYVDVAGSVVTTQAEFGNLLGPLDPLHIFGVWLAGDYRYPQAGHAGASHVLTGIVAGAFAIGVIGAVRRRAWPALVFLGVSVFAWWFVTRKGSPWADGKALMIASPAILFGAGAGAAFLAFLRQPQLAWVLAGALAIGVVWSNALQYHDVALAPRDRMEELADLGKRLDGQGPTLYTEFEEFGKHFLRDAAPEGSSEGWQPRFNLALGRNGLYPRFGFPVDVDQYTDRYVTFYRTIVLRRGFFGSRPSSIYHLRYRGRYYDVWQRSPGAQRDLIRHVSLGDAREPAGQPRCEIVRGLANEARRAGGRIAYAARAANVILSPVTTAFPRGWFVDPSESSTLVARGPGKIEDSIHVLRAGSYDVWLEGSLRRRWRVLVDGRAVAQIRGHVNPRESAELVRTLSLAAGRHVVTLLRPGGNLSPGVGGTDLLGPIAFVPVAADVRSARTIEPARWRSLCGRSLDWVEAVR